MTRTCTLLLLLATTFALASCSRSEAPAVSILDGQLPTPVILWDGSSDYPNRVHYLGFSPDGHTLAVGYEAIWSDAIVELWDVRQLQMEQPLSPSQSSQSTQSSGRAPVMVPTRIAIPAHTNDVDPVTAFSPDGKRLAIGGKDGIVRLWDTANPKAEPMKLGGNEKPITDLVFSPDGEMIATTSENYTIKVWKLSRTDAPSIVLNEEPYAIFTTLGSEAFTPDGQGLILRTPEDLLVQSIIDLNRPLMKIDTPEGVDWSRLALSPDGKLLSGGTAIWRTDNLQAAPVLLEGSWASWVAFSPYGRTLANTDPTLGEVRLWNISNLSDPAKIPEPVILEHPDVYTVAFSPDGKILASGSMDENGSVRLWDYHNLSAPPIEIYPSTMENAP